MKSVRIALKRRFRACHMRQRPTGHSIRQYYQFILLVIVSFLVALPAWSQNITLRPAVVERGGENLSTVLFRPSDIVTLRWEESVPGLELKVGEVPGYYGLKTVQMRGTQASSFSPEVVGLPVGVYYGVLTTSDEESYTSIQIDASADPDIRYSREFRFAVENTVTPRAITPRNSISERVPTFEWESVPGATAYALVVSSSPFTVAASGSSISDFEGLNPVWIYLTTETSAIFGERTDTNPLIQFPAGSLVPGRTYYYSILNAYSTTDPGFISVVLGPLISFTLENRNSLATPILTAPLGNVLLNDPEDVQLRWDPVPGALSYDISVFERLQGDGFKSDQQIYAANSPNTSLSIPAREVFRRGSYRWFVIANDREGAASVSEFESFLFNTPMGGFTFETRSSLDGEELLGVTVRVASTDGGYTPSNPFVNTSSVSLSDSLSVGSYRFIASKDGYDDTTVSVVIEQDEVSLVPIFMDPLPSRITGQVVDANDAPVTNVNVSMTHLGMGYSYETNTDGSGVFSRDLLPGTYSILATKQGYRPAPVITVSVAENQTLTLPDPLVVVDDEVFLSGRVVNQDGIPVPQARIEAASPDVVLETVTDGNGLWSLELNQDAWSVSASKEGLISPLPIDLNLFAGDAFPT
ncbi:MAG: carboxypeptidase-like regulatory domain-containing protein [Bacteroidetes bacterium]|nr:carboxypeptidase-like regulatory domain-containing protein [Bacteroidota bacterium]